MPLLLDTNVLIYAVDGREPDKQRQARAILREAGVRKVGVLSAQVLAEYARVGLDRLRPPLAPDDLRQHVSAFQATFPVLPLTEDVVLEALRGVAAHGFAYFDAQIWAVARLHGVSQVWSEDFQPGRTIEGVTFTDPFADGFDLDAGLKRLGV